MRDLYEAEQLRDADDAAAFSLLRSAAYNLSAPPSRTVTAARFHLDQAHVTDDHELAIGDVVRVRDGGMTFEGVISSVCKLVEHAVVVDFGDSEEKVDLANCELLLRATDFEVDDCVEVQPQGFHMYFRGHIQRCNNNGTFDVKIESDDPDDVELNVPFGNIRKLMTSRSMASMRLQKAVSAIKAINAFKSMGNFHVKATEKLHASNKASRNLDEEKADADRC